MRNYFEQLLLPCFSVKRLESGVSPQTLAQVVIDEYACKGVVAPDTHNDVLAQAKYLTGLDDNDVGRLLENGLVVWHREIWPIELLRMTRIYPPENDPRNICALAERGGKRFYQFAADLKKCPEVVETDLGFTPHEIRDSLPIFGIKGRLHNHVVDGHHRTILAVWSGKKTMECLTAYRR